MANLSDFLGGGGGLEELVRADNTTIGGQNEVVYSNLNVKTSLIVDVKAIFQNSEFLIMDVSMNGVNWLNCGALNTSAYTTPAGFYLFNFTTCYSSNDILNVNAFDNQFGQNRGFYVTASSAGYSASTPQIKYVRLHANNYNQPFRNLADQNFIRILTA